MTKRPPRPRLSARTGLGLLLPWSILQGIVFSAGLGIATQSESKTISTMTGALMVAITAIACWSAYNQGQRDAPIHSSHSQ